MGVLSSPKFLRPKTQFFYGQDNITMKEVMITLLVCVVIYEIFEHVILPLVLDNTISQAQISLWSVRHDRKNMCGQAVGR